MSKLKSKRIFILNILIQSCFFCLHYKSCLYCNKSKKNKI